MSASTENPTLLARGRGGPLPSTDPIEQFRSALQQNALEQLETSRERLTQELQLYRDPNSPAWDRLRQLAARDGEQVARQVDAVIDFTQFVEQNITSGSRFPWSAISGFTFPPDDVLDVDISERRADLLTQLEANDVWREQLAEHRDEFDRLLGEIDAIDRLRQGVRQDVPALAVLDASGHLETFAANSEGNRLPPFGPLHDKFWETIRGIDRLQERIADNPNRALRLDTVTEQTLTEFARQNTDPQQRQAVLDWVAAQGRQDIALQVGTTLGGLGLAGAGIVFRDSKAISTGIGLTATALGGATALYELPLLEDIDGAARAQLGGADLTNVSPDQARFDLWVGRFGLAAEGLGGVVELAQLGPDAVRALSNLSPDQLGQVADWVRAYGADRVSEQLQGLDWARDRGGEVLDRLSEALPNLPSQQPALEGVGNANVPLESRIQLENGGGTPQPSGGGSSPEFPVEPARIELSVTAERWSAIDEVRGWLEEGAPGRALLELLDSSAENLSDSAQEVLDVLVEQAGNSTLKQKQLLDRLDALADHTEALGENPSALSRILNLDDDVFARVARSSEAIEKAITRSEVVDNLVGQRLPQRGTPGWDQFRADLAPAYSIDKNNVISRERVSEGYPALRVKDGEITEVVGKAHDRLSNPSQMRTNYLEAHPQLKSIPKDHQLHHIIPDALVRDHELTQIAREAGYDLDQASNLLALPGTEEALESAQVQLLHSGSHPEWNKYVKETLEEESKKLKRDFEIEDIGELSIEERQEFAEAAREALEDIEGNLRDLLGNEQKLREEGLIKQTDSGVWRLSEAQESLEESSPEIQVANFYENAGKLDRLSEELMLQTIDLMERKNTYSLGGSSSGIAISASAETRSMIAEGPEGRIFELWANGSYVIEDEQAAIQILEELRYDNQLAAETQIPGDEGLGLG